ncbi:MAG: hypothetical protein OEY01_07760 [Desulfobulbaceae bacterium]|nr:hypothetical protein [Desulfobulbaceae bacterium]HIJ78951.1 hypothetical protein [Deltaproteobacteria bacterium]
MIEITTLAAEKLAAYLIENNLDTPGRIAAVNDAGQLSDVPLCPGREHNP